MAVKPMDPAAQSFIRVCAQIIADATRRAVPAGKPARKQKRTAKPARRK